MWKPSKFYLVTCIADIWITDTVCSHHVFAGVIAVIKDSFIILADTMTSHTIKFPIIIIIIIITIIITNIIVSCSITMKFSGILFSRSNSGRIVNKWSRRLYVSLDFILRCYFLRQALPYGNNHYTCIHFHVT